MKTTTETEIRHLLDTRDLRLYGIRQIAWNTGERREMIAEIERTVPVTQIAKSRQGFLLALPHLDDAAAGEMLAKLKVLPPAPREAL